MGKLTERSQQMRQMRQMLEEYKTSGLSRREFCQKRSIPLTTFDYWRTQLRAKPRLVKVEVARPDQAAQSLTLRLANGRSIENLWRFDEEELARLIRIAERA